MDITEYIGFASRTENALEPNLSLAGLQGTAATPAPVADAHSLEGIFEALGAFLNEDLVKEVKGVFSFVVKGEAEPFYVDLKHGSGGCGRGRPPHGAADVTISMDRQTFVDMFGGKLNPTNAFMAGKLSLKGDLPAAMKLDRLMGRMRAKL